MRYYVENGSHSLGFRGYLYKLNIEKLMCLYNELNISVWFRYFLASHLSGAIIRDHKLYSSSFVSTWIFQINFTMCSNCMYHFWKEHTESFRKWYGLYVLEDFDEATGQPERLWCNKTSASSWSQLVYACNPFSFVNFVYELFYAMNLIPFFRCHHVFVICHFVALNVFPLWQVIVPSFMTFSYVVLYRKFMKKNWRGNTIHIFVQIHLPHSLRIFL